MAADLLALDALALAREIERRAVSPVEVIEAVYARLDQTEPSLGCFGARTMDTALAEARQAEGEIARGAYRGPLHGLPLAVKDNIAVANTVTAAGARFLRDNLTPEDAEAVRRLRAAGAIVVGKTNLHELALGSTSDNPWFNTTRNPWALDRVPGGSSGGSAAAVAARQVPLALGTDSGGSVRLPAALCNLVGLKPTHGRVSLRGLVASLTPSGDHIGPLTRTVADAALVLDAIAGADPHDPLSAERPVPAHREALGRDLRGVRVGVPTDYFFDLCDPAVAAGVRAAIDTLSALGATMVEVAIPDLDDLLQARPLLLGELVALLDAPLRDPAQISPFLRARMLASYFVQAGDYARANRVRRLLCERLAAVLHKVDLLAAPTTPTTAYPIEAETVTVRDSRTGKDVALPTTLTMFRLTAVANISGLPSISVPAGFADGLPFGLLLTGRPFEEPLLLRAAHAYEQATDWHRRAPG